MFAGDTDEPLAGRSFGAYRIRRRIVVGGMGVVCEAEQDNSRRIVALKLMRREMTRRSAVRRFQFEVQALARLRPTGIALGYDGLNDHLTLRHDANCHLPRRLGPDQVMPTPDLHSRAYQNASRPPSTKVRGSASPRTVRPVYFGFPPSISNFQIPYTSSSIFIVSL